MTVRTPIGFAFQFPHNRHVTLPPLSTLACPSKLKNPLKSFEMGLQRLQMCICVDESKQWATIDRLKPAPHQRNLLFGGRVASVIKAMRSGVRESGKPIFTVATLVSFSPKAPSARLGIIDLIILREMARAQTDNMVKWGRE